ncbi:MAG: NTP transferase domain-containing protein [Bacilli bacterium]|nr:NTP transferase domain-containing protein [Bacilli bacterium]
MDLTYNEFEVLTIIEKKKEKLSQREISKYSGFSLGTVNKMISQLLNKNLITIDNVITDDGLNALEPYRVKRAIFLAAGFGSRMVPLTLNTPKPLIKVHGKRMIETLLEAVVRAEISEIIIVVGYLGEQFEVLLHKYPNIKFIQNDLYNEANNISSAYVVKDYLENAYVLESDLVLSNPSLIRKYEYNSNFLGIKVDRTDDWCFEEKNGIITKEKIGGINCYQMVGISYYNKEDGKKLKSDIEEVFNSPGGKEKYWEQVQLVEKKSNYQMHIRECQKDDIIEIDTFNELKAIDSVYNV